MVLSLETGAITSQYHVVVDNWFKTVDAGVHSKINFDDDDWYRTFGLTESQYVPDDSDEPQSDPVLVVDTQGADARERSRATRDQITGKPRDYHLYWPSSEGLMHVQVK